MRVVSTHVIHIVIFTFIRHIMWGATGPVAPPPPPPSSNGEICFIQTVSVAHCPCDFSYIYWNNHCSYLGDLIYLLVNKIPSATSLCFYCLFVLSILFFSLASLQSQNRCAGCETVILISDPGPKWIPYLTFFLMKWIFFSYNVYFCW